MPGTWLRWRLRVRRDMLDLLADVGAPPRAQATGRVLGTSQPDARCQLVLLDAALAVVVKAKRGGTTLCIWFDQLASFRSDVRASGERAYQAWWGPGLANDSSDELLDDLRQSLAFTVEKTRRGDAFAAVLEAAVRTRRPDLPRGRGSTDTDQAGQPRMEPSELWAPGFGPQELAASGPPSRGTACDRLGGVIGGVYRRAAGKPQERVRALLEHELQAADLRVSLAYADEVVRSLAATDPGPLRRLLAPARWSKGRHDQADPVAERFPPPAFDQLPDEMDAIVDRLLVVPGVSGAGWHCCPVIGCDRSLAVTIDPWSEATMERVRQLAAPHVVRFHPRV